MAKMRVVQVTRAEWTVGNWSNGKFPNPRRGSVRIKVEACGICHSDAMTKEGLWPGIEYPRVPGHEIAGIIDAVGSGVVRMEGRPTRRRRLAWRPLRLLRFMPARRFRYLPSRAANSRHRLRRRLRRIYDRSRRRIGADPGRTFSSRRGTTDVCGSHHFQFSSQQRRAARRSRRHTRHRRSWPFGRSVRRQDGIQNRCHCARHGQGTAGPQARCFGHYIDS